MLQLRRQIADFSQRRLDAGDITGLDVVNANVDVQRAEVAAVSVAHDVTIAELRLKNVLGLSRSSVSLIPSDLWAPAIPVVEPDFLVGEAMNSRPDVLAARFGVAAANKRADLARWAFLRVDASLDANSGGAGPSNFGPGFRIDIPIFNRNQGGVLRADWTVDQALNNEAAIEQRVAMEVRTAAVQLQQANENLSSLQSQVLPSVQESLDLTTKAFEDGGTSYLFVLQSTTQYLDTQTQELQQIANVRRALAELERSVGRRLAYPVAEEPLEIEEINLPPLPLEPEVLVPTDSTTPPVVSGRESDQNEDASPRWTFTGFFETDRAEPIPASAGIPQSDDQATQINAIAPVETEGLQDVTWWEGSESIAPVDTLESEGQPREPTRSPQRVQPDLDAALGWGSRLYEQRRFAPRR